MIDGIFGRVQTTIHAIQGIPSVAPIRFHIIHNKLDKQNYYQDLHTQEEHDKFHSVHIHF